MIKLQRLLVALLLVLVGGNLSPGCRRSSTGGPGRIQPPEPTRSSNNPAPPNAVFFGAQRPHRFGAIGTNSIVAGGGQPLLIVDSDGDGKANPGDDARVVQDSIQDWVGEISDMVLGAPITAGSVNLEEGECGGATMAGARTGNFLDNPPLPNPPPPGLEQGSRCVPSLCQTLIDPTRNPVIRPNRDNADLGHHLYVADREFGLVHVVNSTTGRPLDAIVTPDPTGLAIDPDLEFLFVTNFATNSVSVIDVRRDSADRNRIIKEVFVGLGPRRICVQPDKEDVLVLNTVDDSVSIIDFATLSVRDTLTFLVGPTPWDIVCTPRGITGTYFAFISNRDGNSVTIYDSGPLCFSGPGSGPDGVIETLTGGPMAPFDRPMGIISNRGQGRRGPDWPGCLVVCEGNNTVAEIELIEFQPTQVCSFPVPGEARTFRVTSQFTIPVGPDLRGGEPQGGATDLALGDNVNPCAHLHDSNTKAWWRFPPDENPLLNPCDTLFLANPTAGTVSVLERSTGSLIRFIDVPGVHVLTTFFE